MAQYIRFISLSYLAQLQLTRPGKAYMGFLNRSDAASMYLVKIYYKKKGSAQATWKFQCCDKAKLKETCTRHIKALLLQDDSLHPEILPTTTAVTELHQGKGRAKLASNGKTLCFDTLHTLKERNCFHSNLREICCTAEIKPEKISLKGKIFRMSQVP